MHRFFVVALLSSRAFASGVLVVVEDEPSDAGIRLAKGELAVHVTDASGAPFPNARVRATCDDAAATPKAKGEVRLAPADAEGWVIFRGMPACVWDLEVSVPGIAAVSAGRIDDASQEVPPALHVSIDTQGATYAGTHVMVLGGAAPKPHELDVSVTWGGGPPPVGTYLASAKGQYIGDWGRLDGRGHVKIRQPFGTGLTLRAVTPLGDSALGTAKEGARTLTIDIPKGKLVQGEVVGWKAQPGRPCACATSRSAEERCVGVDATGGFAIELRRDADYEVYAGSEDVVWYEDGSSTRCREATDQVTVKRGESKVVLHERP